MSIFFICIIASNARLAAAGSGSVIALIKASGVICQEIPHLSLHQPLAKPGHEGCRVFPVFALEEVIQFFQGKQKLENALTISRVGVSLTFPSRFTLVAAMNPCPCGFYGTDR